MNKPNTDPAKKKPHDLRAANPLKRYQYDTPVTNTGVSKPKKEIPFFDFRETK